MRALWQMLGWGPWGIIALHLLLLAFVLQQVAGSPALVPLRVAAEVGVVTVGAAFWLLTPLCLNLFFLLLNRVLAARFEGPRVQGALAVLDSVVSLLLLLGTVVAFRAVSIARASS